MGEMCMEILKYIVSSYVDTKTSINRCMSICFTHTHTHTSVCVSKSKEKKKHIWIHYLNVDLTDKLYVDEM